MCISLVECGRRSKAAKEYKNAYLTMQTVFASPAIKMANKIYDKGLKLNAKEFDAMLQFKWSNVTLESSLQISSLLDKRMRFYVLDLVDMAKNPNKSITCQSEVVMEKDIKNSTKLSHGTLVIVSNTRLPINILAKSLILPQMHNDEMMISADGISSQLAALLAKYPYYYAYAVLAHHPRSLICASRRQKPSSEAPFAERCLVRITTPYFSDAELKMGFAKYADVPSFTSPAPKAAERQLLDRTLRRRNPKTRPLNFGTSDSSCKVTRTLTIVYLGEKSEPKPDENSKTEPTQKTLPSSVGFADVVADFFLNYGETMRNVAIALCATFIIVGSVLLNRREKQQQPS